MTEGIDVVSDRRRPPEAVEEEALGDESLADERFPARDVAVGLDPPAADELPATLRDPGPDLLEHRRLDLLDPGVVGGRIAGEDEVRVFGHPVERRAEGRADLLEPFGPLPQPHGIDVGVAHEMKDSLSTDPLLRHLAPRVDRPMPHKRSGSRPRSGSRDADGRRYGRGEGCACGKTGPSLVSGCGDGVTTGV